MTDPLSPARQTRAYLGDVERLLERLHVVARQSVADASRALTLLEHALKAIDAPPCTTGDHLFTLRAVAVCARCGRPEPEIPRHTDSSLRASDNEIDGFPSEEGEES